MFQVLDQLIVSLGLPPRILLAEIHILVACSQGQVVSYLRPPPLPLDLADGGKVLWEMGTVETMLLALCGLVLTQLIMLPGIPRLQTGLCPLSKAPRFL